MRRQPRKGSDSYGRNFLFVSVTIKMSKKLFTPAFDVTAFRRPQQQTTSATTTQAAPPLPLPPPPPPQTPVSCFLTAPPDDSAGVTKVVPSPVRVNQTVDLLSMLAGATDEEGVGEGGEKKSKKDKKDKKKKRKADEEAAEDDGLGLFISTAGLFKTEEEKKAEVIKFAAERGLTVSFGAPPPPVPAFAPYSPYSAAAAATPVGRGPKPFEEVDVEFETYMAGPGNFANAHLKSAHAQELTTMPTDGKSLGDKKYGCVFCGSLHHLECHQKGNDPPCLRTGAFNRFIQNFLFDYDIAPDLEWRQMLQFKVPGYRRVMAERFASLVGNTSDPEWMSTMQRRAWDLRKQTFSSNAGNARELFHQGRASEFLFFHAQSGSSSPRPLSTSTVPQMGSMGSFSLYAVGAGSPVPPYGLGAGSPVPPYGLGVGSPVPRADMHHF